jgi:phage-related protein
VPAVEVVFYQEDDGTVHVLEWLDGMARRDARIVAKCHVRIERLAQLGHELRRPEADYLRDDVYELRLALGAVNYRILYFFHGRTQAVLAHALTKEGDVPARDIELAHARSRKFAADPRAHRYEEDDENEED